MVKSNEHLAGERGNETENEGRERKGSVNSILDWEVPAFLTDNYVANKDIRKWRWGVVLLQLQLTSSDSSTVSCGQLGMCPVEEGRLTY